MVNGKVAMCCGEPGPGLLGPRHTDPGPTAWKGAFQACKEEAGHLAGAEHPSPTLHTAEKENSSLEAFGLHTPSTLWAWHVLRTTDSFALSPFPVPR